MSIIKCGEHKGYEIELDGYKFRSDGIDGIYDKADDLISAINKADKKVYEPITILVRRNPYSKFFSMEATRPRICSYDDNSVWAKDNGKRVAIYDAYAFTPSNVALADRVISLEAEINERKNEINSILEKMTRPVFKEV